MTIPGGPTGPKGPGGPTTPQGPGGPTTPTGHTQTPPPGEERRAEYSAEHYEAREYPTVERASSRVSWAGIFVGAFVTIAVSMAILSLGAALGLTTVDPATVQMTTVGLGTGIWSILTIIVATFIGAFVSVKASNIHGSRDAGVQGGTVWALSFLMLTVFAGAIGAAGAAVALEAEPVAPAATTVGTAAVWGYFAAAVLGALSGVLGGIAGYPTELRAREERPRRIERRRELRPSEA